jgi:hypothetical protein
MSEDSVMVLQSSLRRHRGRGDAAIWIFVFAMVSMCLGVPRIASAVPSFASQTGLPCAQCHVMAFGPQLTEYGRQFKLNGYTFQKEGALRLPLDAAVIAGYSNLSKAAPTPQPFSDKENLAVQSVSVYFAGRISDHMGAFVKGTYDNIYDTGTWDTLDVRYARTVSLGGHSTVLGIDVNNNPTAQDLWSSLYAFSFPYLRPELATVYPNAAPIIRGALGNTVLGGSIYSMIDNRVYAELGFYKGVSNKWLGNLGLPGGDPNIVGAAPYARISLQQQKGPHYFRVGLVGFSVKQQPFSTTSETNRYTDYGIDGSYQFNIGTPHAIDAHASWIHENRQLDASFATGASDSTSNSLDTFEVDVSYILRQTWTASLGLFDTNGTTNHVLFSPGSINGSASGSPANRGYVLQLEWVPFGKFGSLASPWVNLRMGLQYTGYWRFNGGNTNYDGFGRSAGDNNSVFLFTWLAF